MCIIEGYFRHAGGRGEQHNIANSRADERKYGVLNETIRNKPDINAQRSAAIRCS